MKTRFFNGLAEGTPFWGVLKNFLRRNNINKRHQDFISMECVNQTVVAKTKYTLKAEKLKITQPFWAEALVNAVSNKGVAFDNTKRSMQ